MANYDLLYVTKKQDVSIDDDEAGSGWTCHVTKYVVYEMPNFISQKPIFREKMT